jgi:hypothetical protein
VTIDRSGDVVLWRSMSNPAFDNDAEFHRDRWPGRVEYRARPVATDDAMLALLREASSLIFAFRKTANPSSVTKTEIEERIDAFLGAP